MLDRTRIQGELHAYPNGTAVHPQIETQYYRDVAALKGHAGRWAKRVNGPVDVAYAGAEPWAERYITTASPSEFHASGYRFERLD